MHVVVIRLSKSISFIIYNYMSSFRDFLESTTLPPPGPIEISEPNGPSVVRKRKTDHKWRLKKDQILAHWQAIRNDTAIKMIPLPSNYEGETYDKDTIRVTGSRQFIDSILSRLKELMAYENAKIKLNVIYRMQPQEKQMAGQPPAFVCYIQSEVRSPKQRRRHKITSIAPVEPLQPL